MRGERGYSLVALMATIGVMMVMLSAAVPSWKYVMKNEREEELIFRGTQIAEAIERYQTKNGGAYPASFEVLIQGRYLRKEFEDPLTRKGRWRLIRPGEIAPVGPAVPGQGQPGGQPAGTPGAPDARQAPGGDGGGDLPPGSQLDDAEDAGAGAAGEGDDDEGSLLAGSPLGAASGGAGGAFAGVASRSRERSLRLFNNRSRYDQWLFVAGQPRVVGKALSPTGAIGPGGAPGAGPGPGPGAAPPPKPPGQGARP